MRSKRFKSAEFIKALIMGAALAALVFYLGVQRDYSLLRRLCDSTFVPAVLLLGIAGIMAARNDGSFDSVGYSLKYTFFNHFFCMIYSYFNISITSSIRETVGSNI